MSLAATPNPEQIQRNENEIKDLTRTLQSLDIELQAQMSKVSVVDISSWSLLLHIFSEIVVEQFFI